MRCDVAVMRLAVRPLGIWLIIVMTSTHVELINMMTIDESFRPIYFIMLRCSEFCALLVCSVYTYIHENLYVHRVVGDSVSQELPPRPLSLVFLFIPIVFSLFTLVLRLLI